MTKLDWVVVAVVGFFLVGDTVINWVKELIREFRK